MTRVWLIGIAGGFALAMTASPAMAQSNDEVFPQFQFNFSTPGARANAMGGAFIGLADDASASITNPAGLVRLTRRQVYFEFKSTDLSIDRLAGTRTLFTLEPSTFGGRVNTIGFFSVSSPLGDRFAVAFTRYQFLNYKEQFQLDPRPIPTLNSTFFAVDGESDFSGVSYAGSIAVTLNERLRAGVTLSFDSLSATSVATRFDHTQSSSADQFSVHRTDIIVNQTNIDQSASGFSANVGLLFVPNDKFSLGVSFAKGSTLEVDESLSFNPSDTSNAPLVLASGFPKRVAIHVPNRAGFGVAFRPMSRLLAVADIAYVGYSSLAKDFTLIFNADVLQPSDFEVDNAVEAHFGGEYLLVTGDNLLFVRGGVFSSPNHATSFLGNPDPGANATESAKYNLLPRTTEAVGTVGAGIALRQRFQADVAYVIGREFVASMALRF